MGGGGHNSGFTCFHDTFTGSCIALDFRGTISRITMLGTSPN